MPPRALPRPCLTPERAGGLSAATADLRRTAARALQRSDDLPQGSPELGCLDRVECAAMGLAAAGQATPRQTMPSEARSPPPQDTTAPFAATSAPRRHKALQQGRRSMCLEHDLLPLRLRQQHLELNALLVQLTPSLGFLGLSPYGCGQR